jgi:hypothetical protein
MNALRPLRRLGAALIATLLVGMAIPALADPPPPTNPAPVSYARATYVYLTLGATDQSSGITLLTTEPDGLVVRALVDGQPLVRSQPVANGPGWFYLGIDNSYVHTGISTAIVQVTFLDVGLQPIWLEYDAYDPSQGTDGPTTPKRVVLAERKNTGSWVNAQVEVPDAWFGDRLPGGADLRVGSDTSFVLRGVLVQRKGATIQPLKVLLDGNRMAFDALPQIMNGRVMVPLRDLFNALGAGVEWNGETRTVTGTKGGRTVRLTVGQNVAYVNGEARAIDMPPVIVPPGRVLVPLRFINEALGATVAWDPATYTVSITSPVPESPAPTAAGTTDDSEAVDSATGAGGTGQDGGGTGAAGSETGTPTPQ